MLDEALYVEARTREELLLQEHSRFLRARYLLGDTAAGLLATEPQQ